MNYQEYLRQKTKINEAKQAGVRCWVVVLGHLCLPPVSSMYYAIKTSNWIPFWVGTGIAVTAVPLIPLDYAITFSFLPPAASATMIVSNTLEKRRKLAIFSPEQADFVYIENLKQ